MQMRCYRCGWSFALKRDEIVFAIETLEETDGSHYDVRCTRCRHTNKISLEQLKKFAPRAPAEADSSQEAEQSAEEGVEEKEE